MTYEQDKGVFNHFTSMADANARQASSLAAKLGPSLRWGPQFLIQTFLQ